MILNNFTQRALQVFVLPFSFFIIHCGSGPAIPNGASSRDEAAIRLIQAVKHHTETESLIIDEESFLKVYLARFKRDELGQSTNKPEDYWRFHKIHESVGLQALENRIREYELRQFRVFWKETRSNRGVKVHIVDRIEIATQGEKQIVRAIKSVIESGGTFQVLSMGTNSD